jgi:hypothetical protein
VLGTVNEESLGPGLVLWCDLTSGKMFRHRRIHKYSWTSSDGKIYSQIDCILVDRRRWLFTKRGVGAWAGLIWLRIGTGGIVYQISITTNDGNFLNIDQ